MPLSILDEAERLYCLGVAVHWLRPFSKAPVKEGWTSSDRDSWESLKRDYREGFGLGIRLGEPSRIGDGQFLAAVDFDVRSPDPKHLKAALKVLDGVFPNIRDVAPCVSTGRGFGSAHFYFVSRSPFQSRKLGRSSEMVEVYSPSTPVSRALSMALREGRITKEKVSLGYRLKSAWEVEVMSQGKQVVAPPTRHVDTKVQYEWERELK